MSSQDKMVTIHFEVITTRVLKEKRKMSLSSMFNSRDAYKERGLYSKYL